MPGFWLQFGMDCWAVCPVACGMPRARDLVDPFREIVDSHETEFTQDLERKAVM